jgi:RNA polymerase sigma-70 factor, ECF subfamily
VEVMSMDRNLWAEARAIAARHDLTRAEDLAQDLAVKILERGEPPRNAPAWLERVGRNAAIDGWRVESRRAELLPQACAGVTANDPESSLMFREQRRLVRQALAALPRPQRRAALARFHAELSYEEAGARAGVPAATLRTRVHRALAALRARLAVLRSLFAFPGVQASTLGLALLGAQAPLAVPPPAVAIDQEVPAGAAAMPHFARARVMLAQAAPPLRKKTAPARAAAGAGEPAAAPVQELSFENDTVEGELAGPNSIWVRGAPALDQPSLIELRRHFIPEMLETLEDL